MNSRACGPAGAAGSWMVRPADKVGLQPLVLLLLLLPSYTTHACRGLGLSLLTLSRLFKWLRYHPPLATPWPVVAVETFPMGDTGTNEGDPSPPMPAMLRGTVLSMVPTFFSGPALFRHRHSLPQYSLNPTIYQQTLSDCHLA